MNKKRYNTVKAGTELKLNVHAEPIDGLHMEDYDFEVRFYTYSNKYVDVKKEDMIQSDADNYIALVDTTVLSGGELKAEMTGYIPDDDYDDGYRTEKAEILIEPIMIKR